MSQQHDQRVAQITINVDWCKGCHICVDVCPRHVLEVDADSFLRGFHPVRVARPKDCTACRQCELLCPDLAILVTGTDDQGALAGRRAENLPDNEQK